MRCAPRASNGRNHLGLCALQVKQAVEKIDRVRGIAGTILFRLLHSGDGAAAVPATMIPEHSKLVATIPRGAEINWAAPSESFPVLLPLLSTEAYAFNRPAVALH